VKIREREGLPVCFFDWQGLIHFESVPKGQTVNKELYSEVMNRLRVAMSRKRLDMLKNKTWRLPPDNAPAHTALILTKFFTKTGTSAIPQPPYYLDLAPSDFFVFPELESTLKGRRFDSIEDIKTICTVELKDDP